MEHGDLPRVAAANVRNGYLNLTLECIIFGREVTAFVDTAAQVTVLSLDFYNTLVDRPKPQSRVLMTGAQKDGTMEALVLEEVPVTIGHTEYPVDVHVAPIGDTLLLGLDFLAAHDSIIDIPQKLLQLENNSVPLALEPKAKAIAMNDNEPSWVRSVNVDHQGMPSSQEPQCLKHNPSGAGDIFIKKVETSRRLVIPPNSITPFSARVVRPVRRNTHVVF